MDSPENLNAFDLFVDSEESSRAQRRRGKEECRCDVRLWGGGRGSQERAKKKALICAVQKNDTAKVAALLVCAVCWSHRILQRALKTARTEEMVRIFASSVPAFFWDRWGGSGALLRAAVEGRVEVVRALLALGIEPDVETPWAHARPLPAACLQRHGDCVEVLLEYGADPKQSLGQGFTALHMAAQGGEVRCVEALLRRGADAGVADKRGHTPLHIAARVGSSLSVKALLDADADPKARADMDNTALHFAARLYYHNVPIPGKYVFSGSRGCSSLPDFVGCVTELVKRGADVNAVNHDRFTPLSLAIAEDDVEIAKVLMDNGADLQYRLNNGDTVLHQAASSQVTARCLPEVLQRLGVPHIETLNEAGETPLLSAVSCDNTQGVEDLLRFGADATARYATDNYTALHRLAENGYCDAVHLLIRAGADVHAVATDEALTPLHLAVRHYNREGVVALLENGADVNARATNGCTAVHLAPNRWTNGCLEKLMAHGANLLARDDAGWSVAHYAAQGGCHNTLELLFERGFPMDDRTDDGRTPLHVATASMQTECVIHLLRHLRADINERDATGRTPLHVAARASDEETVRELILNGAQRGARDDFGDNPADAAVNDNIKRLIRLWALGG